MFCFYVVYNKAIICCIKDLYYKELLIKLLYKKHWCQTITVCDLIKFVIISFFIWIAWCQRSKDGTRVCDHVTVLFLWIPGQTSMFNVADRCITKTVIKMFVLTDNAMSHIRGFYSSYFPSCIKRWRNLPTVKCDGIF